MTITAKLNEPIEARRKAAQAKCNCTWNPGKRDSQCVQRLWTQSLPMRMQAVLMAAIRGCDGTPKHDPSKYVVWSLRVDVLNPDTDFDPCACRNFMAYVPDLNEQAADFLGSLDQYPFHFVMHLLHAAEIIGTYHPDDGRRSWWMSFYLDACANHLHVNPESQAQLEHRLRERAGESQNGQAKR